MTLPQIVFQEPAEDFAPVVIQSTCDPTEKPGVSLFRKFVIDHQGGGDLGIIRDCGVGGTSEHKEGRAWDWKISAADTNESAQANDLIQWLLVNDAKNFRRFGLMYLIWNGQIWSTKTNTWRTYTGSDPHTSHVHFSFSWPGAMGVTSGFRWLRGESPILVPSITTDVKNRNASSNDYVVAYFIIGVILGFGTFHAAKRFIA